MAREMEHRLEQLIRQVFPLGGEGPEERAPGGGIAGQAVAGGGDRAVEGGRNAAAEGMGERDLRVDPLETVAFQAEGAKKGRGGGQRMNGGTEIVDEAGEGQLRGAGGAAGAALAFQDQDAEAGAGEHDGSGKPVGPRPHDNRIVIATRHG